MDQRQSDPTGAFSRGGADGADEQQTEFERHAPDGAQPGGGQPNNGQPSTGDGRGSTSASVDEGERDVVTSGTAATSEVADPAAQINAELQGDGTPRSR